jgi:hypothetical protein
VTLLVGVAPLAALAQDAGEHNPADLAKAFPKKAPYSPYAGRDYPTRPFFGDTHLHTAFSFDAGAFGARLGPPDAFRFARGAEVTSNSGQPVKLSRPLDFLVVADRSDGFGFFPLIVGGAPAIMADPQQEVARHDRLRPGRRRRVRYHPQLRRGDDLEGHLPRPRHRALRDAWQQTIKAAEQANNPGRFTAFIGHDWTSNTGGNNLHRNVIFRDDAGKASQEE